jgi:hypothetical protein
MKYGKALGTILLIILIPIYAGGISVVKHFCCGTIENTEFLFGIHQSAIQKDKHHTNQKSSCCENTEQENCCDSEHGGNKCGDEILTFDSNDSWLVSPLTPFDAKITIIIQSVVHLIHIQQLNPFLLCAATESDIPPDKELAHTIQILRL